jgi:hypothetical protein
MKVICKSATELLKFLQRLMRRKTTTYTMNAAHALVNGELHIFGGYSDTYKVLFCLINQNFEIGRDSFAKFKNDYLDREIRRLLFERASGATQRITNKWSRGSFVRKWTKR